MKRLFAEILLSLTVLLSLSLSLLQQSYSIAGEEQEELTPCHKIGCLDGLTVTLVGARPENYIIKATEKSGRTVAVHCFKYREDQVQSASLSFNEFSLDDPEARKLSSISRILSFCSSGRGQVATATWDRGLMDSIIVQCSEDIIDAVSSRCEENGYSFVSFTPNEVTLSVYWNGKKKETTVKPIYEVYYPNGPNCPGKCQSSRVRVKLP